MSMLTSTVQLALRRHEYTQEAARAEGARRRSRFIHSYRGLD